MTRAVLLAPALDQAVLAPGLFAASVSTYEQSLLVGAFDVLVLGCEAANPAMVQQIRANGDHIPIMALIADAGPNRRVIVDLLRAGADDVQEWPRLAPIELEHRLEAVARRARPLDQRTIISAYGPLYVCHRTRCAWIDPENKMRFSDNEFRLLVMLAEAGDRGVTNHEIKQREYPKGEMSANCAKVFICRIRQRLSAIGLADALKLKWGHGYVLNLSKGYETP